LNCVHKHRKYFVTWTTTAKNLYSWSGWSEPIGKGNKRSWGAATGVDYDTAERSLTQLFAKIGY
jgi:hypothetical protein